MGGKEGGAGKVLASSQTMGVEVSHTVTISLRSMVTVTHSSGFQPQQVLPGRQYLSNRGENRRSRFCLRMGKIGFADFAYGWDEVPGMRQTHITKPCLEGTTSGWRPVPHTHRFTVAASSLCRSVTRYLGLDENFVEALASTS